MLLERIHLLHVDERIHQVFLVVSVSVFFVWIEQLSLQKGRFLVES